MTWDQWKLPALIGGAFLGLGAIGTGIVTASRYITLPERVEAGEAKNVQQDEALNKLTAIQDLWAKVYQQQQKMLTDPPAPVMRRRGLREWEAETEIMWCCEFPDRARCFSEHAWTVCDD